MTVLLGALWATVLTLVACGAGAPSEPGRGLPAASSATTNDPVTTLGAALLRDRRLSGNGTQACLDCHRPELAYTDGLQTAVGSTGEAGTLNTPSIINAGQLPALGWARPELTSLERQIPVPLFGTHPVEMGAAGQEGAILERLRADPELRLAFAAAFPNAADPITWDHTISALAAHIRTLRSSGPYDRFITGEEAALSAAARRGQGVFVEVGCASCHAGPLLTTSSYHNIGLYDQDGEGAYPAGQEGLYRSTQAPADMGKFRVPSLRNVARTAPYFHDGSAQSLNDVIQVYVDGGRGAGITSPVKSTGIVPLVISRQERRDLLAFLESLSDDPAPAP